MRLAALLVGASLAGTLPAPAMPILQFARMAIDDQATYISALVEGSAKLLRSQGHPDQAAKAIALFKDPTSHGGLSQLASNMRTLQSENDRNATNPNNRVQPYDVEAALGETLRQNGVDVPLSFLEGINHDFRPLLPPRAHAGGL
jgi:hypothetical protein